MSQDPEQQPLNQEQAQNQQEAKQENLSMFGDAKAAFQTYYSGFIGELVGTAFFAAGITASTTSTDMGDAFVAFSLFFGILMVLPWSGGHLNSAVTGGFYMSDIEFQFDKFWVYTAGQLLGAYLGALGGTLVVGNTTSPSMQNLETIWIIWGILMEAIATFTFVFIIHLAAHKSNSLSELYKVATIALGLYFTRFIAMATTGAALNPTIALGLSINRAIFDGGDEAFQGWYIYIVGPYLGGFLAGLWFRRVYNPYFDPENEAREKAYEERKAEERRRKEEAKQKEKEAKEQAKKEQEEKAKQEQEEKTKQEQQQEKQD